MYKAITWENKEVHGMVKPMTKEQRLEAHKTQQRAYLNNINTLANNGDKKAQAVKENNQKVKNFSVAKNFIKKGANIPDLAKIKSYVEYRENILDTNENKNINCKFINYKKDDKDNYTINIVVNDKKAHFFIQGFDALKDFLDYPIRSRISKEEVENSIPYVIKELALLTDITQHKGFKWNKDDK